MDGKPLTRIQFALLFVQYLYDLTISLLYLLIGRALPRLQIPSVDLHGKVAIVTGANSGIGYSVARSLAQQGATVYLACRSTSKGDDAASQIIRECNDDKASNRVRVLKLDTSSLASVRTFAQTWTQRHADGRGTGIDILFHNAGIAGAPNGQDVTDEGLGIIYATNFLGSFLLTSLLEGHLNTGARIVLTSSTGQYGGDAFRLFTHRAHVPKRGVLGKDGDSGFYADTKSMQVAFAKLLQRRYNSHASLRDRRIVAHAFTPGYTVTPIFGKMSALEAAFDPLFWVLKTFTMLGTPVDTGAATGVWLAVTSDRKVTVPESGGKYWDRCERRLATADVLEARYGVELLERMWDIWCIDSKASYA